MQHALLGLVLHEASLQNRHRLAHMGLHQAASPAQGRQQLAAVELDPDVVRIRLHDLQKPGPAAEVREGAAHVDDRPHEIGQQFEGGGQHAIVVLVRMRRGQDHSDGLAVWQRTDLCPPVLGGPGEGPEPGAGPRRARLEVVEGLQQRGQAVQLVDGLEGAGQEILVRGVLLNAEHKHLDAATRQHDTFQGLTVLYHRAQHVHAHGLDLWVSGVPPHLLQDGSDNVTHELGQRPPQPTQGPGRRGVAVALPAGPVDRRQRLDHALQRLIADACACHCPPARR
mmetsp:Transcript_30596/g.81502  ORF Transcript_30596/g.81502 Transcript_30596/m.81502 type:complete len:282 (+) Transcript_30596:880-1725(+)